MPLDVLPVPALPLIPAVPPPAPPAAPALPPPPPPPPPPPALPPPPPPAPPPPPPPPWAKALSGKTIAATRAAVVISFLDIGHSPAFRCFLNREKRARVLGAARTADALEVAFGGGARKWPADRAVDRALAPVSTISNRSPLPASDETVNEEHDDCAHDSAYQARPFAWTIPTKSLPEVGRNERPDDSQYRS